MKRSAYTELRFKSLTVERAISLNSFYQEVSSTMLSAKHSGTVKGERSLVPSPLIPFDLRLSRSYSAWQKEPGVKTARDKVFFTFAGNYITSVMQMKLAIVICCILKTFLELNKHNVATGLWVRHLMIVKK